MAEDIEGRGWPWLLDSERFMPRHACWSGDQATIHMHFLGDFFTFLAYMAISGVLFVVFWRNRRKLGHMTPLIKANFFIFGAFIFCCGIDHAFDCAMFFWPGYRLYGLWKDITAVVSVAAVFIATTIPSIVKGAIAYLDSVKPLAVKKQEIMQDIAATLKG